MTDEKGNFRKNELLEQIATSSDQATTYGTGQGGTTLLMADSSSKWNTGEAPLWQELHLLLSATIGLKNYGALFEMMPAGIVGGPVKLVDTVTNTTAYDLSNSSWSYKAGLAGSTGDPPRQGQGPQPMERRHHRCTALHLVQGDL
ncbi:hypothetical protein ZWY2020_055060 [Hordeum vulgare]|nr:hypothetical protein ZWY2020_055060 [Hordeum vulgare]